MVETETVCGDGTADESAIQEGRGPALFAVLDCRRPLLPPIRVSLTGLDRVTIGRGETRAATPPRDGNAVLRIAVPDRAVSSQHVTLRRERTAWVFADSGSKNGTFLWGQRVTEGELAPGDLFRLGHTFFRYAQAATSPQVLDLSVDASTDSALATLHTEPAHEFEHLSSIAQSAAAVLLHGESGVGKEIVARAIHRLSRRRGPLVAVNCAALPQHLVESELFGHRRGAFTGAATDRKGHVRAADGGTLFLDEIGDLPAASQAALLRVLQEKEVLPVGSDRPLPVDLRVVSATLRDLKRRVNDNEFRNDLYARVAAYQLTLPPLRARPCDLGLLIAVLLKRIAGNNAAEITLSDKAGLALLRHDWPRNVRELEHALSAAYTLSGGDRIKLEHLPKEVRSAPENHRSRLVRLLTQHRGNLTRVAAQWPTSVLIFAA